MIRWPHRAAALAFSTSLLAPVALAAPAAKDAARQAPARAVRDPGDVAALLDAFPLGKPLPQLPSCDDVRVGGGKDVSAYCSDALESHGRTRSLGVPAAKRPELMDGPQAVLLVDQGNIAGLFVPTRGVDTEQRVYQALADRYGKPLQEARVALPLTSGKTVDSLRVRWAANQTVVTMYAIPEAPQNGTVEFLWAPRAGAVLEQMCAEVDPDAPRPASGVAASAPAAAGKPAGASPAPQR
ncbi:hypothetical protein ACI2S5_18415 [Ralstonia nicotianae]|uniref:hypothetical protein n=1 Tax=Ralstonia pseudosolanacearum TaxID=1310165 RepID=UPI0007C8EEB6|nr:MULTISPECIES: hypothetical protein [Ralstonia]QKL50957.1 hypothetical protein HI816_03325 [Ralstonia solanacearum]MDO3520214.1 hypothetical protein [Ralstonia pseudosolanacearum]MDO3542257.1 hypothetical protein [Ralstonia pseudosolanacearum]OAI66430.1 signal peptide protein [Ralstonia pseudosolanacearum]QKM22212.1 hypothetical protein HI796_03320 [Ralstonia solanacearum]